MNRIKELRKLHGKSQSDIADMLHVNRTTLTKWETGKHNPDVDTLSILADYFNVTTDYLLGRSDDPTPLDTKKPATDEGDGLDEYQREVRDAILGLSETDTQDVLNYIDYVKNKRKS